MQKTLYLVSAFVSVALALVACSGGPEPTAEGNTDSHATAQSAVSECSGDFRCRGGGHDSTTTLERRDGNCHAGAFELRPDGAATSDDVAASWRETSKGFEICSDGACLDCVATEPSAGASPSAKKCTGLSSTCTGRAAGSCSAQAGCYAGWRIRWNGDLEFECKGASSGCSMMHSEESCARQAGCAWE